MTTDEIKVLTTSFEDLKHIDENGKEYWNAHELCKAMGYSQYQKFKIAIERAQISIQNNGKDPDEHLIQSGEVLERKNQYGSISKQEVDGYKLDRYAGYYVAMNADPSKPEVAFAQEYFIMNTRKQEVLEQRLADRDTLKTRSALSDVNKQLAGTLLAHDVEEKELGIVANAGDEGFFDMATKEVKEQNNIPKNKPVADMMGPLVAAYKTVAQFNTINEINKNNLSGVNETSEAAFDKNREVRDMFVSNFGTGPENKMTLEDSKKVERRYNKVTKKQLDAIEG